MCNLSYLLKYYYLFCDQKIQKDKISFSIENVNKENANKENEQFVNTPAPQYWKLPSKPTNIDLEPNTNIEPAPTPRRRPSRQTIIQEQPRRKRGRPFKNPVEIVLKKQPRRAAAKRVPQTPDTPRLDLSHFDCPTGSLSAFDEALP